MSDSQITRQYGVGVCDPETRKVKWLNPSWTYGQAMNTAVNHVERYPDLIVFVMTRIVIVEDWTPIDFEGEEHRAALIAAAKAQRQAELDQDLKIMGLPPLPKEG